jgi:hypothetical protein
MVQTFIHASDGGWCVESTRVQVTVIAVIFEYHCTVERYDECVSFVFYLGVILANTGP